MRLLPGLLFACTLCLSVLPLASQSYLGISGGGGFPRQVVFRGGVPIEIPLKKNWHVQMELMFAQRENPHALAALPSKRRYLLPVLNYLEFPVLARVNVPFQVVDFFFLAGPQIGYGLGLSSTYEEDQILYAERLRFGETRLSRIDVGFSVGFGVEKIISQGRKIFIDLRYYLGLRNISRQEEELIFNEGRAFTLGFMIPIR